MTDSVSLSSLRVQAELDASKYVQGAQAKVDADAKMVASDTALGASMEATDRRIVTKATSLDRLARSIDPATASQEKLEKGTATLSRALETGAISVARHDQLLGLLTQRYGGFRTETTAVAAAAEGLAGAHDHVTGSASRMREGMVLVHEFIRGDWKRGVGSATIELQNFGLMGYVLNPITLGFIGIAGGMALMLARAGEIDSQTRRLTVDLKAMGDVAGVTGTQLHGLALGLYGQGADKADALAALQVIARQRSLQGGALIGQVAGLSLDAGAGLGTTTADAAKKISEALAGGYPAIKKFDDEVGFLTAAEIQNIRTMGEHGDRAGQLGIAIDALHRRFDGLHSQALTDTEKAAHSLGVAWNSMLDDLSKTGAIEGAKSALANLFNDLGKIFRGDVAQLPPETNLGFDVPNRSPFPGRASANQSISAAVPPQDIGFGRFGFPVGGGPAAVAPETGGASVADEQSTKKVQELVEANAKLAAAMARVGVARQLAIAQTAAENENRDKNITGDAAAANIKEHLRTVTINLTGAITEQTAAARLDAAQTLLVADAYLKSEAAGARAEAVRQATIEHVKTGVDIATRAQELLAESTAKTADAGAKQVPILERQASEARRVAEAANISIAAQHAAEVQNKIDEATLRQRIDLENADIDTKARLTAEIERITAAIKKQDEAQLSTALSEATRQQKDQLQLGQAELSLIGANAQERAVLLARIQAEIQLRHMNRDAASEEGQAFIANAEALAKQSLELQRQNEALQEIADFGGKAFDAVAQAMANSGNQTIHFRDILGSLKTEFELLILRMGVLNTLKNAFLGTNLPTLFNLGSVLFGGEGGGSVVGAGASLIGGASEVGSLASAAGAGSGGAGSFGLSSLFNVGGLLNSASGALGGPTLFGAGGLFEGGLGAGVNSLGAATGIFGSGAASASELAGAGLGFGGGGVTSGSAGLLGSTTLTGFASGVGLGFGAGTLINSLAGGNQTNGMIGSAGGALAGAAIGSIIPGVGTIIGGLIGGAAGGGFGGLFGPGLPNNSAGFNLNTATGAEGFTNKGTRNLSAAQGLQGSIDSIIGTLTSSTGGHLPAETITGDVSNKIGTRLMTFDQVTGQPTNTFTGASALSDFADLLMHSLVGLDAETQKIVDHTQHYVELSGNLQFLTMFDSLSKLQPLTTQAADAFAALSKQFDDVSAKARTFDLDIAKLAGGFAANFNQSVAQSIEQIENPLQYALDQEKLTADARRATAEKLGADLVQVDRLTADERQAIQQQYLGNLKSQLNALLFGNASTLTGTQQYQAASASFAAAEAQTAAGHAPGNLGDVVNQFVASSRAVNASGPQYAADFARATASLQVATGGGSPEMTALASQIGALGGVIAKLGVDLPASNDRWSALEGQVVELQAQVVRLLAKVA